MLVVVSQVIGGGADGGNHVAMSTWMTSWTGAEAHVVVHVVEMVVDVAVKCRELQVGS